MTTTACSTRSSDSAGTGVARASTHPYVSPPARCRTGDGDRVRVRCIGGPLDDTDVDVPDPPPLLWIAPWPRDPMVVFGPLVAMVGPMTIKFESPRAEYRLEDWMTPLGEHVRWYLCLDRRGVTRGTVAR